jgi:LPXTG-motif cell wall-anchored protein
MRGRAKVEVRLLDPRGSTWGVKDGVVRAGNHRIATPRQAKAGRWRVEVVAPDYGDRVVKTFTVARTPAPTADAGGRAEAPTTGAPLVKQPVRETPAAAARTLDDDAGSSGERSPWPWITAGIATALLAGAAVLLVRRRRR